MRTCATSARQLFFPWISSAEASPAKTSRAPAEELASLVLAAACGTSSLASLRSAARAGSSSRTSTAVRASGSTASAETWDSSAMRAFRSRLQRAIAAHPTSAHAFSSSGALPTLTATAGDKGGRGDLVAVINGRPMRHHRVYLPTLTARTYGSNQGGAAGRAGKKRPSLHGLLPTLTVKGNYNKAGLSARSGDGLATRIGSGPLNPTWLEWFMGFPDGWTEPGCSGTPSSRSARRSSGT